MKIFRNQEGQTLVLTAFCMCAMLGFLALSVDVGVCTIELDLGLGNGSAGYLTSDLSYDYVRINAEYRS